MPAYAPGPGGARRSVRRGRGSIGTARRIRRSKLGISFSPFDGREVHMYAYTGLMGGGAQIALTVGGEGFSLGGQTRTNERGQGRKKQIKKADSDILRIENASCQPPYSAVSQFLSLSLSLSSLPASSDRQMAQGVTETKLLRIPPARGLSQIRRLPRCPAEIPADKQAAVGRHADRGASNIFRTLLLLLHLPHLVLGEPPKYLCHPGSGGSVSVGW